MSGDNFDRLYDALKADGAVSGTREDFKKYVYAQGKQGYMNRKSLYDALHADGAVSSGSYEEFARKMGLHAVQPNRQAAQKKSQTERTQQMQPQVQKPKTTAQKAMLIGRQLPEPKQAPDNASEFVKSLYRQDMNERGDNTQIPQKPTDYTSQTVAQVNKRSLQERERAFRNAAKEMLDKYTQSQPVMQTGTPADTFVGMTQGQLEKKVSDSAVNLVNSEKGDTDFINDVINQEIFVEAQKRADKAYSEGNWHFSPESEWDEMFYTRKANREFDQDKMIKDLENVVKSRAQEWLSNPKTAKRIKDESARLGIDVDDYIKNSIVPALYNKIAEKLPEENLKRYLPRGRFDYLMGGIMDSTIGTIAALGNQTEGQRQIRQQAMQMTNEGENPNFKPNTWDKAGRGAVGFATDMPLFGAAGFGAGAVTNKVFGNAVQQMTRRASQSVVQRVGEGIAKGVVHGGVTGFQFGAVSGMVQNFSTGEDTSLGGTLKAMLKSGTEEAASFAAMEGMGGAVGAFGSNIGFNGTEKGFWQKANKAGQKVTYEAIKTGLEGLGMSTGGVASSYVNHLLTGEDWQGFTKEGTLESCASAVIFKLTHAKDLFKGEVGRNGKPLNFIDGVAQKTARFFLSENAQLAPHVFTEEEKAQLFNAGANVGMKPMDNILKFAKQAKKMNPEDVELSEDGSDLLNYYQQIMVDPSVSWDAKAKFTTLVMGTMPESRPMMDYHTLSFEKIGGDTSGYKKYVNEYSANGELLSKREYDTLDKRDRILYDMRIRRENQRLWNAMGALVSIDKNNYDLQNAFYMLGVKRAKDNAEMQAFVDGLGTRGSAVEQEFTDYVLNNGSVMERFADVAKAFGMETKDLVEAFDKDPLKRIEVEQEACVRLRREMEKQAFPEGKVHEEQSNLEGKDIAEDNGLGTEQPNGESVKAELGNLAAAEDGLEKLMRDNDVFGDNFEQLQKQGLTNPQIYDWMIQQGVTEEELQPFVDYINANARVQGMQQATQQKIEETVGRVVQDWSYRGTMNGQKSEGEQVVYVQDRDGRTLIIGSGDVAFDQTTGRAKEGVGDMLVCFDPNAKETVYLKAEEVTFMQTQSPEDFGNEYRNKLQQINSQAYNEAAAEQAERNANRLQGNETEPTGKGTEANGGNESTVQDSSDLYKVAKALQGKIGGSLSKEEASNLTVEMESRAEKPRDLQLTPDNWYAEFGEEGKVTTPLGEVKMGENQVSKLFEKGRSKEFSMIKPTLENPDAIIEVPSSAADGNEERASSYLFVKTFLGKDGEKVYYFKSVTVKKDGMEISISSHYDRAKRVREALEKGKLLYLKGGGAQTEQNQPSVSGTTSEEVSAGSSTGKDTHNSPSGNGSEATLTFEDGTSVPMKADSKGRNVADYSQMTPEHGAEWIKRSFGENADKVVDGKIKKAEAALKEAEKIKIDYSADDADIIEAEAKKKEAVDAAQRDLDFFTRVKNAMNKKENLEAAGGTGATGGRYEQWRKDGYYIGEGGVRYDRQKKEDQTGVYGREVKVDFAPKVSAKGRAKVVEIDSVQASHKNGQANPWHFGPDWQPKDRTDEASLLGQNEALNHFDPEKITGDGNAYIESAPSVNERHEVIQGNNRAEILRKLYDGKPEEAAKYKQWLIDNAERFGLDAEEIAKMKRPVLVNELPVDDATAKELGQHDVKEFESGGKATPRTSAVINMLGDKMQSVASILVRQGALPDDAKMSDLIAQNADKVLDYLSKEGVLTATEEQTLRKDKTTLRQWMTDLLKNGLFEGDKLTEASFSQLPDNAQKAVLATYLRDIKSPEGAKIKKNLQRSFDAYVDMMDFPGFANAKNLAEARAAVNMEIEKGNKSLFGEAPVRERYSTFELELAAMYKGLKDQKTLTRLMDKYFDAVQGDKATNRQLQLGETPREPISKEEAIKEVFDSYDTTPAETQRQVDEAVKAIATEITKQVGEELVVTDEQVAQKALEDAEGNGIVVKKQINAGGAVLDWGNVPSRARLDNDALTTIIMQNNRAYIDELDNLAEGETIEHYVDANGYFYTFRVDKDHHIYMDEAIPKTSSANKERITELKNYYDGERARHSETVRSDRGETQSELGRPTDTIGSAIRGRYSEVSTVGGRSERTNSEGVVERNTSRPEQSGSKIKQLRSKDGDVYGFTDGEKIYLDTKRMKPETALHEYTHLWSEALKRVNPKEWENVKKLFDDVDGLKEEVKKLYPELKGDDLYEEMITTFSGREGTKKLEAVVRELAAKEGKTVTESAKAQGFIGKVKTALQKYWKGVADMLHIHFTTAEEVADKVLADWAKGVDPREIKGGKTDTHPKGKTPIEAAALAYHEEKVSAARKAYEEAKKSGDQSEIKRTRDELKQRLDDKLKAQGIGLIQRRKEIAKEIGAKEAEKITKPWKDMDGEERMATAEKAPLTEEEIRNSTSEENRDLIEDAIDYLNGNHGFAQQIAYLKIYEDVRNRHEDAPGNSGAADGTQLAASGNGSGEGLGLGTGREGGGPSGELDRGTGAEAVPGELPGGKDSEGQPDLPAGERGNSEGEGSAPRLGGLPAGDTERTGSGADGGNGTTLRHDKGRRGGNGHTKTNGGGKPATKQGTTWRNRTGEEIKQEAKDAKAGLKAALAEMMKRGRGEASISLVGLNSRQIEYVPELMKAVKRYGMSLIDQGIYKIKDWMGNIREGIYDEMKAIGFSDKDIDDFIEEMWNSKMPMDGETHTIAEWCSIYGHAQLRKKLGEELGGKYQMQVDAEPIEVKVGDRKNIEETLPFLLPQQQDDVLRAETQFFGEEHTDREHAYGKGYMFTNGTGTGKTYTGLGIAKRLQKQGKGRILIVTPSQKKVTDWIKDGKNLNMEIRSLDDWAKERGTTATTESGDGMVITTFANFGLNKKLLETEWDAVIYDESHRIMENKKGAETARSMQHYMLTNRDESHCFLRLQEINKDYQKMRQAANKFDAERNKEIERIQKEYKRSHPSATPRDVNNATFKMLPKEINSFAPADAAAFPKIGKAYQEFTKAREHYYKNVEPKLREQAKQTWKNTKTVFLSATPFNTRENLDYAEGYIFKYPERGEDGMDGRTRFYLDHFGAAYKFRYHRLENSMSNPDAVAKQEVAFSDYLQHTLGTMSGRIIDSPYDYSRDFPTVSPDHAEEFNQAVQEAVRGRYLGSAYHKTIGDYNYGSALFETMKVANIIQRMKDHLAAGRKIVVFHRRVETKAPIKAPFAYMLEVANEEISQMRPGKERDAYIAEVNAFRQSHAELLQWEKTLDYSMPREQIAKVFGKDNVLFFSGKESKKAKEKAVDTFNDDNSGKNIIVIQEASGKEGISLHDTTGKHQRVCITLGLPQSPITALQIEGRTYRIGNKSNAIFEYPILGLNSEMMLFGEKFNNQVSTTENLALGSQARNLRDSFANGILEHSGVVPIDQQGVGGKEFDTPKQGDSDPFDDSVLDYYSNQKLNKRNREGVDYFPTPEPLGYKMVEWAHMGEGDTSLEPSAGHGAIARYVPKENQMVSIEPSQSLFTKLQLKAGGLGRKFLNTTFENYDIGNKHDVVVMNPPFGTAGATAIAHLDKAFKHLDEGGRVVAIIPRGSTDKKFDKWFDGQKNAAMRAEVDLPDIVFQQAGTSVRCRVVVVDKITDEALRSKAGYPEKIDLSGHYDKIEDFFEELRDIEMPDRIIDTQAKMQKKARTTARDLKDIKDVRQVTLDKSGITVSLRGEWKDYSINFEGSDNPQTWKEKMKQVYTQFDELEKSTWNEDKQAVCDEMKKLACKLAGMTEEEMQRGRNGNQGGTHFRIEEDGDSSENMFSSLHDKLNDKKEYYDTVDILSERLADGRANLYGLHNEVEQATPSVVQAGIEIIARDRGGVSGSESVRPENDARRNEVEQAVEEWAKSRGYWKDENEKGDFRMETGKTFSGTKENFDGVRDRAVEEKGIVMPNLNKESVKVVHIEKHSFGESEKDILSNAKAWAKENLATKDESNTSIMRDGTHYIISKTAIDKYLSESAVKKSENLDTHISVLPKLTDVIHESIEAEIHPDYKKGEGGSRNVENGYGNNVLVHRLYGAVELDGKTYRVKTTMQEFRGGEENKPHSYEVTKIELLDSPGERENPDKPHSDASNNSISTAKLLNGVEKSYDSGKKLLDESKDLPQGETRFRTNAEPVETISKDAPEVVKHIAEVSKKVGGKVKMVQSAEEVTNPEVKKALDEGKKVTGWYDEKTGEVHLYMPNIHDRYTAEKTIWHETVGHKGMRGLMGEHFDKFLREVWYDLDNPENAELKKLVDEERRSNPLNIYDAIEEGIARLSEEGKGEPGFWRNIRNKVADFFREIGYRIAPNTKDVKYLLWLSRNMQKNPNDPFYKMRAEAVRYRLEHENIPTVIEANGMYYDNTGRAVKDMSELSKKEWNEATDGKVHFRTTPSAGTAIDRYHKSLDEHGYMATEAYMDNMLSLKKLMEAVDPSIKRIEDVKSSENPYILQNTMQGAMSDAADMFERNVMRPLGKAMADVLDAFDGANDTDKIRNFNLYMIKKHGLERNRVFFVRDYIKGLDPQDAEILQKQWNAEKKDLGDRLRNDAIRLDEYYDEMDEWIRNNVDKDFDASEHDYSGMHGLQEIDDEKKPYYDSVAIQDVMDAEANMESVKAGSVKDFWSKVHAATSYSLYCDYKNGFQDRETYTKTSQMFDWFVPLRKFDEATAEDVYGYVTEKGDPGSYIGSVLMGAEGRKSLSETNILAQIGAMGNTAILNGGKNAIKQAFMRFARSHDSQGLITEGQVWLVKDGTNADGSDRWVEAYPQIPDNAAPKTISNIVSQFEADMKAKQATGDAKIMRNAADIGYKFERAKDKSQHVVDVKVNGKTHRFYINGNPRAAQALNGLLEHKAGAFGEPFATVSRFMAQTCTSYNPEFVMRNMMRDWEFASSNLLAKEGVKYTGVFEKYYAQVGLLEGIRNSKLKDVADTGGFGLYAKYRNGTLDMNDKIQRYFKEFMENGGETGWVQVMSMKDWTKKYKANIKAERNKAAKVGKGFFDAIFTNLKNVNEIAENMARFATYCASRDYGRSKVRSAYDAKEVSTNFNRHGSGSEIKSFKNGDMGGFRNFRKQIYRFTSAYLRNTSMFFNAGIQSTNLLIKNLKNNKAGTIGYIVSGPLLTGLSMALLNNVLIAGEDEKERNGVKDPYGELPDYIRRNNLCVYVGGGEFITIPLAIEERAFYGIGDLIAGLTFADNVSGQKNPWMDGVGCLSQLVPVMDYLGNTSFGKNPGEETQKAILPSATSPFVEWAYNSDWKGAPIQRDNKYDENQPAWMLAYKGTPDFLINLNKKANAMTNDVAPGNQYMKGDSFLDAVTNPSALQHFYSGYLGGAATFGERVLGLVRNGKETETKDIPFVRSWFYTPNEQSSLQRTKSKWYSYKDDMETTIANVDRLKSKKGPIDQRLRNMADLYNFQNSKSAAKVRVIKQAERQMKVWTRLRNKSSDAESIKNANKNIDLIMQNAVEQLDMLN